MINNTSLLNVKENMYLVGLLGLKMKTLFLKGLFIVIIKHILLLCITVRVKLFQLSVVKDTYSFFIKNYRLSIMSYSVKVNLVKTGKSYVSS